MITAIPLRPFESPWPATERTYLLFSHKDITTRKALQDLHMEIWSIMLIPV